MATLVAQVKLVVLGHKAQPEHPRLQTLVLLPGPALAAVGFKSVDRHPQGHAGLAALAVGPVGEHAAAPEAVGYQARIDVGVDQVAGRGHLRTRFSPC